MEQIPWFLHSFVNPPTDPLTIRLMALVEDLPSIPGPKTVGSANYSRLFDAFMKRGWTGFEEEFDRIVPRDRAAQVTPTVRKVAVGAAETTPVVAVTNLVRTLKLLKQAGLWIVGADAAGDKRAHQVDLKGPVVLVLGAEGTGLRHLTRQTCDFLVRLPQLGAVESLNVSVAAGMLLYEAVRQRGAA